MSKEAMKQAHEALGQFIEKELTVGQRYTNEGSRLLEAHAALRAALAEQAQPVAWAEQFIEHLTALHNTDLIRELDSGDALIRLDDAIAAVEEARDRYTTPPAPVVPQPLTDEEILSLVGWERAEMYMKLTPNFPVDEAKQETLKNYRAVEAAVLERMGVQR